MSGFQTGAFIAQVLPFFSGWLVNITPMEGVPHLGPILVGVFLIRNRWFFHPVSIRSVDLWGHHDQQISPKKKRFSMIFLMLWTTIRGHQMSLLSLYFSEGWNYLSIYKDIFFSLRLLNCSLYYTILDIFYYKHWRSLNCSPYFSKTTPCFVVSLRTASRQLFGTFLRKLLTGQANKSLDNRYRFFSEVSTISIYKVYVRCKWI